MKKTVRMTVIALAVACSLSVASLSAYAASTPENSNQGAVTTPSTAENSNKPSSSSPSSSSPSSTGSDYVPDVSGGYYTSSAKILEKLSADSFLAPIVYVDPVTFAVHNVYDADGNLIPATLSTDKHYYIVRTTEGTLYLATGI